MRFYLVLAILVAATVGGYRVSKTYVELDDFHRRYLEGGPSSNHVVFPPLRQAR